MNNSGKVVTGELVGAGLIWARAQFDRKANEAVQVNQWLKLTIEISCSGCKGSLVIGSN